MHNKGYTFNHQNFTNMNKYIFTCLASVTMISAGMAQTSFPSPGASIFCSTTDDILDTVTATDGVAIAPYLRLSASCLDTNLALFSLNTPASFRRPTFCYNNGYFPSSYGAPLAISRNSTANGGSCAGALSDVVCDFTQSDTRPKGLSFIICDVDNPYDTISVKAYSGGTLVTYDFTFMESNPDSSYAWTAATGSSGTEVHFNGGGNGVWGEASASSNWAKGAIEFTLPAETTIDSVIVTHIMRNNRSDINAAISIGNFQWTDTEVLPVTLINFTARRENKVAVLKWSTAGEQNSKGFEIEKSLDGRNWTRLGFVASQAINGNSTEQLIYSFADKVPLWQGGMYRLKQMDYDGAIEYSSIATISAIQKPEINIYPNPTNSHFYIEGLSGSEMVSVYDAAGRKIVDRKAVTGNVIQLSSEDWSAGLYHISIITAEGKAVSYQMIKQ